MRRTRGLTAAIGFAAFAAVLPPAQAAPVAIHTPLPSAGILISVATGDGDGSVTCVVQPSAAWAENVASTVEPDSEATTIRGVVVGTTTVVCSVPRNVYVLLQADAEVTDRDTGTEYADGATPCRVAFACADVSEAWLVDTLPARYLVTSQLVISTLLPMTKIGGPCVLRTATLADCTVPFPGEFP